MGQCIIDFHPPENIWHQVKCITGKEMDEGKKAKTAQKLATWLGI